MSKLIGNLIRIIGAVDCITCVNEINPDKNNKGRDAFNPIISISPDAEKLVVKGKTLLEDADVEWELELKSIKTIFLIIHEDHASLSLHTY